MAEVRKRELVTGMQVIMCSFRILGVPHSATTTTTLATAQIDVLPTIEAFIATAGLSDTNRYDNQVFQSVLKANSADCEGWLCKWSGDLEVLMESLNQNVRRY